MPTYPVGLTAANAIARVRARTNSAFGEPVDADILDHLNAGLEQVAARLDAILVNVPVAPTTVNQTTFVLPQDIGVIKSLIYSTLALGTAGATPYPVQLVTMEQFTIYSTADPVGGPGGIPSIAALSSDSQGVITLQVFPFISSGFLNIYYYQRPALWSDTASQTTLDSAFQEPAIIYACAMTCYERELNDRGDRWMSMFEPAVEMAKGIARRRRRTATSNVVTDVSDTDSIWPTWMR